MSFSRYLLRRAALAALLVFLASSAALIVTLLAPSGCEGAILDEEARARCLEREAFGLNRPILTQYVDWLGRAARLDLGLSVYYTHRPVAELVGQRALNTAVLAVGALAGATLVGIPLGIYTGMRRRGPAVSLIRSISLLMLSLPPLLASLALVLVAARTGWLPVGGMSSAGAADLSWLAWMADVARHVPVPALALAIPLTATLERLQSQSMSDAVQAPFVRAARARGLSAHRAALRHAWPLSLRSVLAVYGFMIGTLFSGSFVVEIVTAWPGLGRLMYEGLRAQDLNLVAGCAAIGALFLALGSLLADLLLASIDPRVRMGAAT